MYVEVCVRSWLVVSDYGCGAGVRVPCLPIAGDGLRELTREQQWVWLGALGAMFSLGACRSVDIVFEAIDGSCVHSGRPATSPGPN